MRNAETAQTPTPTGRLQLQDGEGDMGRYEAQEDEIETERQTCLTGGWRLWLGCPGLLSSFLGGSRTRKVGEEKQVPILVTTYLDNCEGCRELM